MRNTHQENQQGSTSPGSGKATEVTGNCPLASHPGSSCLDRQGYEWEHPGVTQSRARDALHTVEQRPLSMANSAGWLRPLSRHWPDARRHVMRDLARASSSPRLPQS